LNVMGVGGLKRLFEGHVHAVHFRIRVPDEHLAPARSA
jgi:hypothetical protein